MMYHRKTSAFVAALVVSFATSHAALAESYDAGVVQVTVPSPERGADLEATIWYPASPGGDAVTLGENIFFRGTEAMRGAPIADGLFPLIVASHGAGLAGHAPALSWLAAPLAKRGFVVAAPTHPGNTGPNRSAGETIKLWLRPTDLSVTLDTIAQYAPLESHINFDKIGVLGLSMGGNTALLTAGARLDPTLLASYCDTNDLNASLCDWLHASGVDLRAMDLEDADRDNSDDRVRFAMAIDPAPADVFSVESFSEISIPLALLNLGKVADIPATLQAAPIAQALPGTDYDTLEDANHSSMFAVCNPGAAQIVREEGIEDPICEEGGARRRDAIHAQIVDLVSTRFSRALDQRD